METGEHAVRRAVLRPASSSPAPSRTGRTTSQLLGRPVLGTGEALAQSLAIGPVVSVGLVAYLIAAASGANAPLVIMIVFVSSLALGWTLSLYGRHVAGAGTIYEYLGVHGPQAGVLGAGFYFLPALVANGIPLLTSVIFESFAKQYLGFDPGWWSGAVGTTTIVIALSYLGVRPTVRVGLLLTVFSAVPMLVLAAAVIAKGGVGGNTLSVFDPSVRGGGHVFAGLLFGVLVFSGFESAACVGEEARLPHHAIPRAILLGVILSGAFFLVMVYAGTIGFGPQMVRGRWGADPLGLAALGDRYVGHPLTAWISLAVLIDSVAVQLAVTNTLARGYFALSRDRLLPAACARVSRYGTPAGGLIAASTGGLVLTAVAAPWRNHLDMFSVAGVAFTLLLMPIYIALVVGALRFVVGRPGWPLRTGAVLASLTVPVLAIYGTFHPFPTGARRDGVLLGAGLFLTVLLWFLYLRVKRPREVTSATRRALRPANTAEPVAHDAELT